MQNPFEPLTDEELNRLDNFLLDRIDEEADTQDMDEGLLCVSELDGLFTAIVSGPELIPPSRWFPAIWGDFEPEWKSMQEVEEIHSLLMRHMNGIAGMLMEQPEDFEPIFEERRVGGKTYTIVDEWCEGYMIGVDLAMVSWDEAGGPGMIVLLTPIRAFTSQTDWLAHSLPTEAETDTIRSAITPNIREIHTFWLARRAHLAPSSEPRRCSDSRVGRNDPCPCGSGKKFKKCCLH